MHKETAVDIVIDRELLLGVLQRVSSIVPQKPTLPVLSNFLLRASGGKLSVSGTDMDISMTSGVECRVEREGSITVNAKRFLSIIRELPPGEIMIAVDGNKVTVHYASGQSSLLGISSGEYPALRDTLEGVQVTISGSDLGMMVDKTGFSVSTDRTRLALTGIYWKVSEEEMVMVSTDGHRLSLFSRQGAGNAGGSAEAIVPPKSLLQAAQIVGSGEELKQVVVGDGAILFDFGTTTVFSKLIEGPYPNFRQVIPASNSKRVFVANDQLSAAVKRVSVLSNAVTHQVKLEIDAAKMELSTRNDDIGGESRDGIEVRYDGEPIVAAYNANFLSDILRRIDSDEVMLELETPKTACIIRPVGEPGADSYLYLIMPLRLSE
jgi:DNA polymerase III subunit beta